MFKTILLTAAIAGMAPAADAGDLKVRFGLDSRGNFRVGVGLRSGSDHRHRHEVRHVNRVWVPGHVDRVAYKVWVPARRERVLVPSRHEYRTGRHGRRHRVLISHRCYETRVIPGHYVTRYRTVRHPGHWEIRSHVHYDRHRSHRTPRGRDVSRRGRRGIESLGRGERRSGKRRTH